MRFHFSHPFLVAGHHTVITSCGLSNIENFPFIQLNKRNGWASLTTGIFPFSHRSSLFLKELPSLSVGFPLHGLLRHKDYYFCNHLKILMLLKNAPLGTSLAFITSINHISHKPEPTEIRGKAWDRTITRQATGLHKERYILVAELTWRWHTHKSGQKIEIT